MSQTNVLFSFILVTGLLAGSQAAILDGLINEIAAKVDSYQVLKPVNYTPPFSWAEKLGLYRSAIRLNLFGDPVLAEIRNGEITSVFDNDMFSTGWIVTCLLEASLYGKGAPQIDADRLQLALEAIGAYNDKNVQNADKTLMRTFWPQVYNSTYNIWQQQPINIRNVALSIDLIPWDDLEKFFGALKLEKLVKICQELQALGPSTAAVFAIPPDFDDTYLNLGLGATLSRLGDQYPKAYQSWLANNTNVQQLIDATVKYAYEPFASDPNKNLIDPRTYFYARGFIQDAQSAGQPLSLVTTWIQNVEEQRYLRNESVSMPFNLNNVDVTVGSNSIYGMSSGALFNVNGFGDLFLKTPEIQQVFLNTTKFISWAIQSNFTGRPDLAQVYYPSNFNFLWYASRTLFLIENESQRYMSILKENNLINNEQNREKIQFLKRFRALKPVFDEAKGYLSDAFENKVTENLLAWKRNDDGDQSKAYFCDFLGMNDTTLFGKHHESKDDCLFSTAQAINVLISTWTYQSQSGNNSLIFKEKTPSSAKNLIEASVNWLKASIFDKKYKKLNAFFSGSVKGFTSLPFWYPVNYLQYLNGTVVPESQIPESDLGIVISGVSGPIDEPTYQKLLQQKHFGEATPLDFPGYNTKDEYFPFWSSEPYTYAVSLLALAQYNNLAN